ncbi:MAG: hypothetical protein K2P51_02115 [Rhabdochlamydiaceae bacterium]|nr:hypothetical protein [Rhabdochlamydiaceae bacterium]
MGSSLFDEMPALTPLDFFSLSADVKHTASLQQVSLRTHRLASTSELLAENAFAQMAIGWNEEGLVLSAYVEKPFEEAEYPQFSQADALEVFLDTRDLKTAGFLTKFCHHFLILPQEVQGIRALELTRFRTEDAHSLCEPSDIQVTCKMEQNSYELHLFFPAHCLHGYDPSTLDRLGFTYRLHRKGGSPQHFSVSSSDFTIEQHPRLWGSLKLTK